MVRLAFYKAEGKFVDKVIRWFTNSKYSHCEIQFSDGMYYSADAWNNMVVCHWFQANPDSWDFVDVVMSEKDELKVKAWCDSKVGSMYDWIGIALSQVLPLEINDPSKWFCSELCVRALQQAGLLEGIKACMVSPKRLAELYDLE